MGLRRSRGRPEQATTCCVQLASSRNILAARANAVIPQGTVFVRRCTPNQRGKVGRRLSEEKRREAGGRLTDSALAAFSLAEAVGSPDEKTFEQESDFTSDRL